MMGTIKNSRNNTPKGKINRYGVNLRRRENELDGFGRSLPDTRDVVLACGVVSRAILLVSSLVPLLHVPLLVHQRGQLFTPILYDCSTLWSIACIFSQLCMRSPLLRLTCMT